jgi:divalent metal cation (Fe/Co/Zn/Cd) transporter
MSETATTSQFSITDLIKTLATNVGVAVLLFTVGTFSGSASMVSEAVHAVIDSSTEVILVGGNMHARRWASARYFWGLVASINMFAIGGCWAIWEGYQSILNPRPEDASIWLILGVLGLATVMELISWRRAVRSLAATKTTGQSWLAVLRNTANVEAKMVAEEDTADIAGRLLAALGNVLWLVTGSAIWDGIASITIGLMLVAMAYELGAQNIRMLTGQA